MVAKPERSPALPRRRAGAPYYRQDAAEHLANTSKEFAVTLDELDISYTPEPPSRARPLSHGLLRQGHRLDRQLLRTEK